MRRLSRFILAGMVAAAVLTGPDAHAYTHGCFSFSGFYYWIPPELPDPDWAPVWTGDCYTRVFNGDTFSGSGPFQIACLDGSAQWMYAVTDAPAAAVPLACGSHTFARVSTGIGGWVIAGNIQ